MLGVVGQQCCVRLHGVLNTHLSRFHGHLTDLSLKPVADSTKFAMSPTIIRFTCHFGISLSAQVKHIFTQKPVQLFK